MLKTGLQLTLSQQLTMTPQLQQAIKLLQLSTIELQTEIQTLLESNPMLERADDIHDESTPNSESQDKLSQEYLSPVSLKSSSPKEPSSSGFNNDYIETLQAEDKSLLEHLKSQLNASNFSQSELIIGRFIIDDIDDRGYLTQSIEELTNSINEHIEKSVERHEVATTLKQIQQFDPLGIAARSLSECLLIQLDHEFKDHPDYPSTRDLIANHLHLISKNDFKLLKRKLKLTDEGLNNCFGLIQLLEPKPGRNMSGGRTEYIIPDLIVHKTKNGWTVSLNDQALPKISINSQYSTLSKEALSQADSQYIRNQLQEAKWFLKSLHSRNETLLKVATQIMVRQKDFLEHGEEAMKPMVLQDIAEAIEMHESTVSRITTQKYIHTPKGIFELKYFFSSHVATESGGACSSTAIRAIIKKIVANENPEKPLSDSQIAKLLTEQGINVARRTIAKYRESLKIPSSSDRKNSFIQSN